MSQTQSDQSDSAQPDPPVAVVDCGTNTTRLLIDHGVGLGHRLQRITGLGRGAVRGGELREDAIGRVLDVLSEYREAIQRSRPSAVRAVATSAARDAANGAEFLRRASDTLGFEVELLSGDAEAAYGFAGAVGDLSSDSPAEVLVLDIGGGSTEFAYGTLQAGPAIGEELGSDPIHGDAGPAHDTPLPSPRARLVEAVSVDMGSVRWTERFLSSDPPQPAELSSAIAVARLHLDDIDRCCEAIAAGAPTARLVGVAGTITTVAAVEIGLVPYDPAAIDGFVLTRAAAEDVFRTLATERLADRIHNPGLQPDRAPVIVGGCCILLAAMRHWGIDECLVRERDLLDGIAAELRHSRD